jgi:hypothetical protein
MPATSTRLIARRVWPATSTNTGGFAADLLQMQPAVIIGSIIDCRQRGGSSSLAILAAPPPRLLSGAIRNKEQRPYQTPSRRRPGSTCATHDTELGGASPLRAARSGTASQRQLRRSDAGWGGSRRQNGGPTNRKRIQGQCDGATRRGTGTPDTPSDHRTGRSDGHPAKVQCLTVGDLPSSPGEPE